MSWCCSNCRMSLMDCTRKKSRTYHRVNCCCHCTCSDVDCICEPKRVNCSVCTCPVEPEWNKRTKCYNCSKWYNKNPAVDHDVCDYCMSTWETYPAEPDRVSDEHLAALIRAHGCKKPIRVTVSSLHSKSIETTLLLQELQSLRNKEKPERESDHTLQYMITMYGDQKYHSSPATDRTVSTLLQELQRRRVGLNECCKCCCSRPAEPRPEYRFISGHKCRECRTHCDVCPCCCSCRLHCNCECPAEPERVSDESLQSFLDTITVPGVSYNREYVDNLIHLLKELKRRRAND